MKRVMPSKGFYADEHEFIEKLSQDASKASRFGKFSETVASGGEVRLQVKGDSIRGTLPGDMLVFERCLWDKTRPGDIVLFRVGERVMARRVVRPTFQDEKFVFLTKSDASPHLDRPLEPEHVMGRLKAVERGGKKLPSTFLRGSFVYRFTEYGTRSFFEKILDLLLMPVPQRIRPTVWFRRRRDQALEASRTRHSSSSH